MSRISRRAAVEEKGRWDGGGDGDGRRWRSRGAVAGEAGDPARESWAGRAGVRCMAMWRGRG